MLVFCRYEVSVVMQCFVRVFNVAIIWKIYLNSIKEELSWASPDIGSICNSTCVFRFMYWNELVTLYTFTISIFTIRVQCTSWIFTGHNKICFSKMLSYKCEDYKVHYIKWVATFAIQCLTDLYPLHSYSVKNLAGSTLTRSPRCYRIHVLSGWLYILY